MAKHNLVIAMGLGKPKGGGDTAPPSYRSKPPASDPTQADTEPDPADPMEGAEGEGASGGISPEEVDYSDNDLCETCSNMGHDGTCMKYGFPVDKTGHCEAGYEPKGGQGMEAMGGMPGMDQGAIGPV